MEARQISKGITWLGAVDWDRSLFDSLIPLPDGTTYNAYLVEGNEKTALLDTVDPPQAETLLAQLQDVPNIDYVVSHHAEQDHSGTIPLVLEKFPQAKVVCTPKAKSMLMDLLGLVEDVFLPVADGETLSLGGAAPSWPGNLGRHGPVVQRLQSRLHEVWHRPSCYRVWKNVAAAVMKNSHLLRH